MSARLFIVVAVIGSHALGLWALQGGLLHRVVETIVPVQVLADWVEPPQPRLEPPPPPSRPEAPPPRPVLQRAPTPAPQPAPLPVIQAAPPAPIEVATPSPPPLPPAAPDLATPTRTAPASEAPPAAPVIVLPSSNAAYLNNPPPAYPPLSRRLGEQGRVVVRAFIDVDGSAARAEIRSSSGFERLDQAAVQTVLRWRYVPGKRAGQPEAMWFNIPISFVLE